MFRGIGKHEWTNEQAERCDASNLARLGQPHHKHTQGGKVLMKVWRWSLRHFPSIVLRTTPRLAPLRAQPKHSQVRASLPRATIRSLK